MTDFPISELIPHTGNMILLERVLAADEHSLTAELIVRGDGLLAGDDKTIPALTGIEYMAQTIAAYAGLQAKQHGEAIKIGFLLGTRRYHSNTSVFNVGATLTVRVEKIIQDDALSVFNCHIQGDGVDVQANLNVYQPPDEILNIG